MDDELRPCPFCGHPPKHFGSHAPWVVACDNPDCQCQANADYVGAWNTRPVEDALRARVAELEAKAAIAVSVPWEAINSAFGNFFGEAWADEGSPVDVIEKWLDAHAPKESN